MTSDVLVAIKDKIGIGHEVTVEYNGIPQYRIAILPLQNSSEAGESTEVIAERVSP